MTYPVQKSNLKYCIKCKILLDENSNWANYNKKNYCYICRNCQKISHQEDHFKTTNNKKQLDRYYNKRSAVIHFYGDMCTQCGEDNYYKLTINCNKDNSSTNIINFLYDNKIDKDGYQVLCYNCNSGRNINYKDKYYLIKKEKVINHYGGKCKICNENRIERLTMEYNNEIKLTGSKFYSWIIKNHFPNLGLQITCYNCKNSKLNSFIEQDKKLFCRNCNILLTLENCHKIFFKYKINFCKTCDYEARRKILYKNRSKILVNLGGKCECCGVINLDLLSIDHIAGNGIKDRKSYNSWGKYLKNLNKMDIVDLKSKYRCLCYNCNYTRGFWGKCPHELKEANTDWLPISNRSFHNNHLTEEKYKERELILRRISRMKHKLELIKAYGGKCCKCGEDHPMFLVLDHINNTGYFDKNKGTTYYQYLKSLGYPGKGTQLQLLCHNCNAKKEYINNRKLKQEDIKTESETYTKQEYSITAEEEAELWKYARYLYAQFNDPSL